MKVFRLWLKKDQDIPQFKRLAFTIADIPLARVLKQGIHPLGCTKDIDGHECCDLSEKVSRILNDPRFHIPGIAEFGFCTEAYIGVAYDSIWDARTLSELLTTIKDSVYFVDRLSFQELSEIAQERIRRIWSYEVAKGLLMATQGDFNSLRGFLKTKDRDIKLSGYEDLKGYPLHEILSPSDFEDDEKTIIAEALSVGNFRKTSFLEAVSTPEGYLSLMPEITDFQLLFSSPPSLARDNLLYNCRRKSGQVVLMPDLEEDEAKRPLARQIASEWGESRNRYCFPVSLERLEEMVCSGRFSILFPSLTYRDDTAQFSRARLRREEVATCRIGTYICSRSTADEIRQVLKGFKIPQTGRKEDLVRRLIGHAAAVYNLKRCELDDYFSRNRFIYIPESWQEAKDGFKVLEGSPIRNLLLTMYALQHLRGNAILEADHVNDAYDVKDLARAVINGDVNVEGTFIRVEDGSENERDSVAKH